MSGRVIGQGCAVLLGMVCALGDLSRIVSISDVKISPDGRRIAALVSRPDFKTDTPKVAIELIDVASGARRVLTRDRTGLGQLHWSPHGRRLGFIAKTVVAGPGGAGAAGAKPPAHAQVFVMPMDGGDAERVTDAPRDVSAFSFSPDGKSIAYVTANLPANAQAIKSHDDAFRVTDNNFEVRAARTPSQLWLVSSAGGAARRLTEGSFSLDTDQRGSAPRPAFGPGGRVIAFTRFPDPYWARSFHSVIDSVPLAGGTPSPLVALEGSGHLRYAPSGDAFAFLRPRNGDENNGNAVYVSRDGHTVDVTRRLARNIDFYAWLPGGGSLLLVGKDGTHSVMWRQGLTGRAQRLTLGDVEIDGPPSVASTGAIAFVARTRGGADELYVMSSVSAAPRRLTDFNAFLAGIDLGRVTTLEWRGPGGFHEDGVLTHPPGFRAGRKYPLVLLIHGGPEGENTVGFSPLPQLLAAAGFLVFEPNYRGSTGLGDAYQHAIYRDTGEGPGRDVMAGLKALERRGSVDVHRIGVSGWSYGGYMTDWLTSHYPKVWKAAVAGAALNDWVMDYTIAYYQQGDVYFFGGSPWTRKDYRIWRAQSPIAYALNVKAPTLIMGDVFDPNVPLVNSYEWYHALRDNGVTVKFYAYPAHTHFPSDIVRQSDVFRRWVGWMKHYLK